MIHPDPAHAGPDWQIVHGECEIELQELDDCSVDAIVTDPPYGLEFMGKEWDRFRVDDPGTTRHRGERAGAQGHFADGIAGRGPVYGGARPTTSRCSGCGRRDQFRKVHECAPGAEWRPELIDPDVAPPSMRAFGAWCEGWARQCLRVVKPGAWLIAFGGTRTVHRLACGLEDAGWEIRDLGLWLYRSGFPKGQASLKPAWEPWVLARRPVAGSMAANAEQWGTGWLNIEAARVPFADGEDEAETKTKNQHGDFGSAPRENKVYGKDERPLENYEAEGRWPANIVTTDETYAWRHFRSSIGVDLLADVAKAGNDERPAVDGVGHPTVKPLRLMRHLVRLVAPPHGLVLDPFLGSGTTIEAAIIEGRRSLGIERDAASVALAVERLAKPIAGSLGL